MPDDGGQCCVYGTPGVEEYTIIVAPVSIRPDGIIPAGGFIHIKKRLSVPALARLGRLLENAVGPIEQYDKPKPEKRRLEAESKP